MRPLLAFLVLPLLAFGGCAKQADPASPVQADPLLSAAIAAQGATLGALGARDSAAASGDVPLCLGASALVAGLPVASSVLMDLHSGAGLSEIPAITWDGGPCLPDVLPDLDPVATEARIAEYVTAAIGTVRRIAESNGLDCGPIPAVLAYVQPIPGAVVAVMQGATSAGLPAVGIVACPVEAVALAPAG